MSDDEVDYLAKAVRTRTSAKGVLTKNSKKLTSYVGETVDCIDTTQALNLLNSTKSSQESLQECMTTLCDLDKSKSATYIKDYEASELIFEPLLEQMEGRWLKSKAFNKLHRLHKTVHMFHFTAESSGLQLAGSLETMMTKLEDVLDEFGGYIRNADILSGLAEGIQKAIADLRCKLPAYERGATAIPVAATAARTRDPPHRRLPAIETPKFNGDILEWDNFWTIFHRNIHANRDLEDDEKLSYLQMAVKDSKQANLVDSLAGTYTECVASLKANYSRPKDLHQHYSTAFINCSPGKEDSTAELSRLHVTLSQAWRKIAATKKTSAEEVLEAYAETLLPPRARRKWKELHHDQRVIPTLPEMFKFLELEATLAKIESADATTPRKEQPERRARQDRPRYDRRQSASGEERPKRDAFAVSTNKTHPCLMCKDLGHNLYACPTFLALTVDKRTDFSNTARLCRNCLCPNHEKRACTSSYRCRTCNKMHHSLLHQERPVPQFNSNDASATRVNTHHVHHVKATDNGIQETLSPTLSLIAQSPSGREANITALYDTGASLSLITSQVVNQLGLRRRRCNVSLVQALGGEATNTNLVDITLTSRHTPGEVRELTAVVVPKLGGKSDPLTINQMWEFLAQLPLANPDFRQRKKLDLILGQDIINQITLTGNQQGKDQTIRAQETIWGWTVQGPVGRPQRLPEKETTATSHCTSTIASVAMERLLADKEGNDLLRSFFTKEDMDDEKSTTMEEQEALQHFTDTHKVLPGGRIQVSLPKRQECPALGSSRPQAVKRYLSNERSLLRRKALQPFQDVVEEYFDLQHAEEVPQRDLIKSDELTYYMPLHAVVKQTSTSTKLRVVFDASATTTSGVSLNDTLLIGPTVYPPLTEILARFGTHRFVVTADITKMFREIVLDPGDRDYHRFLWRKTPQDQLKDCRMTRVTFGVTSSPFLATQALRQIADLHQDDHPEAARALKNDFYVDDLLSGATTQEEAIHLQRELQAVLQQHGLTLKKWRSNSDNIMKAIPLELHEREPDLELDGTLDFIKTLGVKWNSKSDEFHVATSQLDLPNIITKRTLTSDIAKTFDVMGWFAPATLSMKALIQRLWAAGIDWDDQVPVEIQEEWTTWRNELPQLAASPIARPYYRYDQGARKETTLQGFSDASLKGYSAVVYVRATYEDGPPTISILQAKTKVAPLKGLTVPRLELCGALLLASLITNLRTTLNISLEQICCWTDSQIVLHWLDGKSRPHKTFVGNRVRQTLQRVPSSYWHHVPGIDNPADCASRGINPGELRTHGLWWHGPAWLSEEPIRYPPQPQLAHLDTSTDEIVKGKLVAAITSTNTALETRYSSYRQLLRTVAWCLRFRHNINLKDDQRPSIRALTIKDVTRARELLYRRAQARTIDRMKCGSWEKNRKLQSLNPTKDDVGIFRVNGRLRNTAMEYAQRCPIILGGDDCLTRLLILHHHIANGHAGPTLLMSAVGRDHYLVNGMAIVKAICRRCVICTRYRKETETQLMGQLPKVRVTPSSPFTEVGTDFAGPLSLKKGHTRKPVFVKGYICAFICLSTKAVHLEVVGDLTTEAFLSCLTRFVSRRGLPDNIYSDNGSNYVGASRELEAIYQLLRSTSTQKEVISFCTEQQIGWHFSPARAPHFGGIWESAIKSFKGHLRRITKGFTFTIEEITTIVVRIEAALNSRPLMPIYSHSEEGVDVLTPGHFLIGKPLNALPEHQIEQERTPRSRYVLGKQLAQLFWRRWSTDYLRQLHKRTKWQRKKQDVKKGDIVLIRGDTTFTDNCWPMARVVEIFPGSDGLVRAVDLRVGNKVYRRPIAKLTVLVPGSEPESDIQDNPLSPAAMAEVETQQEEPEDDDQA